MNKALKQASDSLANSKLEAEKQKRWLRKIKFYKKNCDSYWQLRSLFLY